MKLLICSFYTHNYSKVFYDSVCAQKHLIENCGFYAATEICEKWPDDFCISRLKNKCLHAASKIKPDWMVLLPGCDSVLLKIPILDELNKNYIYYGHKRIAASNTKEKCSLHLYPKVVYENFRYDENFHYFWDDFDFFYNTTKDIPKEACESLLCEHEAHESLISKSKFIHDSFHKEKELFLKKYLNLHNEEYGN